MLVLSRKRDESIIIAVPGLEPIVVTVVDIRGDKARIGVNAPTEIPIHRQEVYEAIEREKEREGARRQRGVDPKPAYEFGRPIQIERKSQ